MDNFNNFKRHDKKASIDGFVSNGRRLGEPAPRPYKPNRGKQTPALDHLIHRNDGFHSINRSAQSFGSSAEQRETEALLDEPIILDDIDFEDNSRKKKHYYKGKQSKFHKNVKRTTKVLATLLIITGLVFGYKFYNTQKHILAGGGQAPTVCNPNVDTSKLSKEGDSRINILLLGIGGEEHQGGDLTDTIIVASVDPIGHKVELLSIPRDLWVQIPGDGYHKINQAYADFKNYSPDKSESAKQRSGIEAVDKTLEDVLDINLHYHVIVDFNAFKDIVNALGGVDLNVTKDMAVYERLWVEGTDQHYTLDVKQGKQHFDGNRALYFARSRYTSARGDFDRSERQRALLVAIKDKTFSLGTFSDPLKLTKLMDGLGKNVYTDFGKGSIKCMYQHISKIQSENIKSIDLVTEPHDFLTTGNIGGQSIVQPKAGIFSYDEIQQYVHSMLKDGFITRENAKVLVYNATDVEGLATRQSDLLKSFGYSIEGVNNTSSPTNPFQTQIIDLSSGANKYTRHYLEKRYGVTASSTLPTNLGITTSTDTKFVIILGKDVTATTQN